MVKSAEYKRWSSSHTWQSWREHYKNKKNQLDPLIEAYLVQNGTADMVCSLDEGVQVKHEEAQGWHEVQSSTVM
ncbi:hypothetical protein FRC08_012172 [Ceratobasidium sp. 394]|nr:hypothetical protein FRC08_012172 [Ceratobasidium sp. 394]